jgi:hypothetical protein
LGGQEAAATGPGLSWRKIIADRERISKAT